MKKTTGTKNQTTPVTLEIEGLAAITAKEQLRVNGGRNDVRNQWPKQYF